MGSFAENKFWFPRMDFGSCDLSLQIFPPCVPTFILERGFTEFPQFEKK